MWSLANDPPQHSRRRFVFTLGQGMEIMHFKFCSNNTGITSLDTSLTKSTLLLCILFVQIRRQSEVCNCTLFPAYRTVPWPPSSAVCFTVSRTACSAARSHTTPPCFSLRKCTTAARMHLRRNCMCLPILLGEFVSGPS